MTTTSQKPSQNGTTAKPAATPTNSKETPKVATNVTVAALPLKQETAKEQVDQIPLEDRIFKVQKLSDLIDRREKLKTSYKKLNSFKLSTDGSNDELRIEDSEGNEFMTTNSSAIQDVVETLKTRISKLLAETEAQIVL